MKQGLKFFSLLLIVHIQAQAGDAFVYLADTTKLFFVRSNEIYTPDKKQLLYFQKGNIFFSSGADDRENIYLMCTSMNIWSDKQEYLYEKDNREASYAFSDAKFYAPAKDPENPGRQIEIIHVEKSKKWLAFYASHNDSLIAYYHDDSVSKSAAVLVAYTLIKNLKLEKKAAETARKVPAQTNPYSILKPVWGNTMDNEWMWDGDVLRPRWNADPYLAWIFDGQTAKPLYGNNIYRQYAWDGETLKPVWSTNRAQEWSWDGRLLKPVWDTDWANQYIIENGIIKPWSNVHTEREWRLDGEIPMPLIILVLSGIAKAN